MYPIKICIVDGPDGPQHVWLDEGLLGEEAQPFAPCAGPLAVLVAETIWNKDVSEARNCLKDPGQLVNIIEFSPVPKVWRFNGMVTPHVRRLTKIEQRAFIRLIQEHFERLSGGP